MMDLTAEEYAARFNGDTLEKMQAFASEKTGDPEIDRELPKIQEALRMKKEADDADAAQWRKEHGEGDRVDVPVPFAPLKNSAPEPPKKTRKRKS